MASDRAIAGEDRWSELRACNGGGGCVLVEYIAGCYVVRDTKNPQQAGLVFSRAEWAAFRRRIQDSSSGRNMLQSVASALRSVALILRDIIR